MSSDAKSLPKPFRVAVVGDARVGKTSLVRQLVLSGLPSEPDQRIENSHMVRATAAGGLVVPMSILDTAKEPSEYADKVHAFVVVFSMASSPSLTKVVEYLPDLLKFREKGGLLILVGTHMKTGSEELCKEARDLSGDLRAPLFPVELADRRQAMAPWKALLDQRVHSKIDSAAQPKEGGRNWMVEMWNWATGAV